VDFPVVAEAVVAEVDGKKMIKKSDNYLKFLYIAMPISLIMSLISIYFGLLLIQDNSSDDMYVLISLILICFPIIFLLALPYVVLNKRKKVTKQRVNNYFTSFNSKHGFNKQGVEIADNGSFTVKSNLPVIIEKHVNKKILSSGKLPITKNLFNLTYDTDRRGKADNIHLLFERTTLQIQIPNIKNQFLLNSKLNDAKFNTGNLSRYPFSQKIETSESIYKYVNVHVPSKEQINILTLLTPDVIALMMRDFRDADIEIIDNQMYCYFYGHINEKIVSQAILNADEIIRKMKLGINDSRDSKVLQSHIVSRISVDNVKNNRLRNIPIQGIVVFIFIISLMFVFAGGPIKLLFIVPGLVVLHYLYTLVRQYKLKKQISKEIAAYF
jgi:hypothetical protein